MTSKQELPKRVTCKVVTSSGNLGWEKTHVSIHPADSVSQVVAPNHRLMQ